ncbi:MAG: LamG-like jellyroll fold domain-containing protein, partial [Bacteroidota bacterium]
MNRIIAFLFILCACLACNQQIQESYSWDFEPYQENKIKESYSQTEAQFHSIHEKAEFVSGITAYGLRLDGNSTFLEQDLPQSLTSPFTASIWVALETYPTDVAGFFTFKTKAGYWVAICVDQFGKLMILTGDTSDEESYSTSEVSINKFEWANIVLVVNKNKANLYLNGEEVTSTFINVNDRFEKLQLGRGGMEHFIHIFPTMYVNGIIDEFKIWDKALNQKEIIEQIVKGRAEQAANLNIPESRFSNDFHRPKYHVLPAANWTNETHGLIYYKGKYHIFNQKNGTNLILRQMNWGHFSSPDLVQWTEHRPALTPEEGYDQIGCWSGHAIIDDEDQAVIMYTGGDGEEFGMCLAYPKDDELIEWEKYIGNPVVKGPPSQYIRKDFRDPYIWKEGNFWYMIVGYGIVEDDTEKGAVLYYKSKDLKNWESLGIFFKGDPEADQSGPFWEMPIFWKMGDKWILLVQPIPHGKYPAISLYWTGNLIGEEFIPDHKIPKKLEVINRLLSPSIALDENGETITIAIIPDLIPGELQRKHGWTHLYSIPRVWKLVDGYIHQTPHRALEALRNMKESFKDLNVNPDQNLAIGKGHQLEVIASITPNKATEFGFLFGKNRENGEQTALVFDLKNNQLIIDQSNTSLDPLLEKRIEKGALQLNPEKPFKFQLFIDGSVIEG